MGEFTAGFTEFGFCGLFADIYWKNEHRLMCTSEVCTAAERDRYEKSVSMWYMMLALSSGLLSCGIVEWFGLSVVLVVVLDCVLNVKVA